MHCTVITGSRDWTDRAAIEAVLIGTDMLLVGDCPDHRSKTQIKKREPVRSADAIAYETAIAWDIMVVRFDADWATHGSPKAAHLRNQALADRAAVERDGGIPVDCHAFVLPDSQGTYDCLRRLERHSFIVQLHAAAG